MLSQIFKLKFISIKVSEILSLIMFRKETYIIILDILAETHGFEGDFALQLAVGMPDVDRNKIGVSFAFEYTKLLKQNLLYFSLRNYLSCSIFKI